MNKITRTNKDNFLYPLCPYHGTLTQDTVLFNNKLQEFAHKVGFIANLHTGGKLPSEKAYGQVESLWRDLESTKMTLSEDH
ncbi:hypothetical protein [Cyanothece sp. BG0011]|uniref:DUF7219 family protein n=1 Tax=Cyanothece sp. BG0011 TaxID=2082950 RepID=UPI000D1E1793|nr:hypothetical protein [Cyanothece sp. BG0011]